MSYLRLYLFVCHSKIYRKALINEILKASFCTAWLNYGFLNGFLHHLKYFLAIAFQSF